MLTKFKKKRLRVNKRSNVQMEKQKCSRATFKHRGEDWRDDDKKQLYKVQKEKVETSLEVVKNRISLGFKPTTYRIWVSCTKTTRPRTFN